MAFLRFLFSFFLVSTALHFGWEISQMGYYSFSVPSLSSYDAFIQDHWVVAAKDGLITVVLYLLVGILVKNAGWAKRFNRQRFMFLIVLGFLWAVGVEYHATEIAHRWTYAKSMPMIPIINVGVAPVLQMIIIPFFSIWFTRKQLSEK
jgi:hypothetical protein